MDDGLGNNIDIPDLATLSIPLGVLKSVYIPLFKSEGREEEKMEAVMQLTKGAFSVPVKIIGNNMKVIDTLPALLGDSKNSVKYGELLSDAELKDKHIPGQGEALVKSVVSNESDKISHSITEAWSDIFAKYGNEIEEVDEGNEDLDLEYD